MLVSLPILGNYSVIAIITAVVVAALAGIVLIGGIKRVSTVSQFFVPIMLFIYFGFVLIIIVTNIQNLPMALHEIVYGAFNPAAISGGVAGSVFVAVQKGVARGIFSNEAGLGSAPIAVASTKTKVPVEQGLVSMIQTFVDTIIICMCTGLAIVITGA